MAYGTHSTLDALATIRNATVADYGEDKVWDGVRLGLAAHNAIMADMVNLLAERSTDQLRNYGGNATLEMHAVDEFGMTDAQKTAAGVDIGFPLRLYNGTLQWTRKYMQNATPAEVAAAVDALMQGDVRTINREIKRAIFTPTATSFVDRLTNGVTLPVKPFLNSDSLAIPEGPNGETFTASSHTHYLARVSTLAASDIQGLITHVVEHHATGEAKLFISRSNETALRAFPEFYPYVDARLVNQTAGIVANGALDVTRLDNRAIGVFGQAEVWVKPWVPANYMFAFVQGAEKPLVYRTRRADSGNLELVYEDDLHPLRARSYEREFGVGVWNRTNGAVLYVGATTYAAPTLTT